jgi:outer membrane protein assembly factor BamB
MNKGVKLQKIFIKIPVIILFFTSMFTTVSGDDNFSQWRGPNRDGKYPDKNLLKKWPEQGPELLWRVDGIGEGHSSAAVANNCVYVTGKIKDEGYLHCFDLDGNLLWKSSYGPEWYKNYPGARSTPTVVRDDLYLISGLGKVNCFNSQSGNLRWSIDMFEKFEAGEVEWGIAESPLIDGDQIICTPGGSEANIVALDRYSGDTIWISKGHGDPSAYCSPVLVEYNNARLIVTMTAESILGVDAENGKVYWRVPQLQEFNIHADSPLFHDGSIFCISGQDNSSGSVRLGLSPDAKNVKEVWRHSKADNLIGGVVLNNGYLYGSRYERDEWFCVNWETGKIQYVSEAFGGGSIIVADDLLYCYSERGMLGLIKADATGFRVISKFKIKSGRGPHWAHPVIHKGRIYIRHGESLLAFDITDTNK